MTMDAGAPTQDGSPREVPLVPAEAQERADLEARPEVVLSLLEPDQVVEAKQRMQFGLRRLTLRHRFILWSLRIYVVVMLLIVLLSVYRAVYLGH